jgi:hypothetical protein
LTRFKSCPVEIALISNTLKSKDPADNCYIHPEGVQTKINGIKKHTNQKCFTQHPHLKEEFYKKAKIASEGSIKEQIAAALASLNINKPIDFYPLALTCRSLIDTGCTNHVGKESTDIINKRKCNVKIETANGSMDAKSIGDIPIIINNKKVTVLEDMLVCSDLLENLISVSQLTNCGYTFIFHKSGWEGIHKDKEKYLSGPREGNLYVLHHYKPQSHVTSIGEIPTDNTTKNHPTMDDLFNLQDMHERLGHPALTTMKELAKSGAIKGFTLRNFNNSIKTLDCHDCLITKLKEQKYLKGKARKPSKFGELISVDIKGPISPQSRNKGKYVFAVTDHSSRYRWIYIIPNHKHETSFPCFQEAVNRIQAISGNKIVNVRFDNEFRSHIYLEWCRKNGTEPQFTIPHHSAQNGVSERAFQTLFNMGRAILHHSNFPKIFWGRQ